MTFTNELPTVPGFYAWRLHDKHEPEGCSVRLINGVLVALAGTSECPVAKAGGQWCRLVPAEEIEKAYHEGIENWANADAASNFWEDSRAKRVMEGKE